MSWNHRILAHEHKGEVYLQIHEVYYNTKGVPHSHTYKGTSVAAKDIEGIKWVLDKMKECADKPILSVDSFPKEYNH